MPLSTSINSVSPRAQNEEDDALTKIFKGLQIANQILSVPQTINENKKTSAEADLAAKRAQTGGDPLEAAKAGLVYDQNNGTYSPSDAAVKKQQTDRLKTEIEDTRKMMLGMAEAEAKGVQFNPELKAMVGNKLARLESMMGGGDFGPMPDTVQASGATPVSFGGKQMGGQQPAFGGQPLFKFTGKPGAKKEAMTAGQTAVDKDYAKHYNDFTAKGMVNSEAAIQRLEAIATEMENDTGFGEAGGGRIASVLPDVFRARDAIRRRDSTRNAANTTLKELFGGQLSDAEREAAAKEYYNDALDNKTNAKLLRDKIAQLKDGLSSEKQKAQYYENKGTLKGFRATPLVEKKELSPEDQQALEWAKQNSKDPRAAEIRKRLGQ